MRKTLMIGRSKFRAGVLVILMVVTGVESSRGLTNGLALTPPMGWNSWNNFGCGINEALIRAQADAMATNGMKAAGYQYINLDDCWQLGRDTSGVIITDPAKFPSGMKALVDYVHARGLRLGLYSSRGLQTCGGGGAGGYGFENLDAQTYAAWGVDYLKYDNCGTASANPATDYFHMSDALMKCGRPIVFSICFYPFSSWDPDLGNLWRTGGDIRATFGSILTQLIYNAPPAFVAGPGRWNDPDMLEVGRGMTTAEDTSHFTLWCIMGAPLIAGNDLTAMSATILSILTNPEVIAVDQDAAGEQGIQVAGFSGAQVWCKPLGTGFGSKAVALFNPNSTPTNITANWTDLGLLNGAASVRDLWARADLGVFTNSFTTNVLGHGVVLVKVVGTGPVLPVVGTNYLSDLQPVYAYVGAGTLGRDKSIGGNPIRLNGVSYSKGLGVQAFSGVEYRLGAIGSRFKADIGLDDEVGANGSVVFKAYADGIKVYDSGVIRGGGAHQTLDLDVTGVSRLTLGVMDGDDGTNSDHADWAGARITVMSTVPSPPTAPTGLVARPGSPVILSWNTTPAATNYNVKRSMSSSGPYTNIGSVPSPGFSDSNVVAGVAYYYVVSAVDALGEGSNATPAGVTVCSLPPAPSGLTASGNGLRISLNWNASPGASSYSVSRSTVALPFQTIAAGLPATSFTDTNVTYGATYQYTVAASNACNQGGPSSSATASTPPLAPTGLSATPGSAAVVLNWSTPLPTVSYNLKRSASPGGPYAAVATNVSNPPYLDVGLTNGITYYYVVSAVNGGGESPDSASASATPCGGWPAGWTDQDIGSVGFAGGASSCSNAFIVEGGGADIWNAADAFHFASTSLAGDICIVARVTAVADTDPWAKAGVMFRSSSAASSAFADVVVSPVNGVNLQWRVVDGGFCNFTGVGSVTAPAWVKLARSGTTFTGSYSGDGVTWSTLGTIGIAMPSVALAGLAVTAHKNAALCLAAFDNVAMQRPPALITLSANGGSVSLSWPGWATNYNAYSASNLIPPIQWQLVTNVVLSNNGVFRLSLPENASRQFFRLQGH